MVRGVSRRKDRRAPARRAAAHSVTDERATGWRRPFVAAGVGIIAFVVFLFTAARDIFPGDTPEFITVALTGGVAHPPGYPLLSILGVAFGELPVGPLPFRIGLISVLSHALTVVFVFLTADRITRNVWAAAAGALILAFGRGFWAWSLVAETFPLNDLLAALVLFLLVVWHERPALHLPLYGAAVAFGLGFANQQTITLLAPAILVFLYLERSSLPGGAVLARCVVIAVVAALVPYTYVAVAAGRHAVLNWGGISSPTDFLRSVLRVDYGAGQLVPTAAFQGGTGIERMADFLKNANLALLVLAIPGLVYAYRRLRWYFWLALVAFLISGPVFIAYVNANVAVDTARLILARFYLLPQVVIAPCAALGIAYVATLLRQRIEEPPPWTAAAVTAGALAIAALELFLTYGSVDRHDDHVARYFAEDILASAAKDTVILADGDHVLLPLIYLQAVEGQRPDVTVVAWPLLGLDWYQRELRLRHPELNLPLARYDASDGLLIFVRANPDRVIVLTSEEDQSIQPDYGIYPRGLTLPIVNGRQLLDLNTVARENDTFLASYRVPGPSAIDRDSFERFILTWYAMVPYRVGAQYDAAKLPNDARVWYQRALAIDPQLQPAIAALRRLGQ